MHVPGISSGVNKQSYGATFLIASLSAVFSILMAPWDSFFWPSSQKSGALVPPLYYVLLCLCSLQSQTVRGRRTQSQQKNNGNFPIRAKLYLSKKEGFSPMHAPLPPPSLGCLSSGPLENGDNRKPLWPLGISFPEP